MIKDLPGKIRLTGNDVIDTAYTVSALYDSSSSGNLEALVSNIDFDKLSDEYDDDIYEYCLNELDMELQDGEVEAIEEMISRTWLFGTCSYSDSRQCNKHRN